MDFWRKCLNRLDDLHDIQWHYHVKFLFALLWIPGVVHVSTAPGTVKVVNLVWFYNTETILPWRLVCRVIFAASFTTQTVIWRLGQQCHCHASHYSAFLLCECIVDVCLIRWRIGDITESGFTSSPSTGHSDVQRRDDTAHRSMLCGERR